MQYFCEDYDKTDSIETEIVSIILITNHMYLQKLLDYIKKMLAYL